MTEPSKELVEGIAKILQDGYRKSLLARDNSEYFMVF